MTNQQISIFDQRFNSILAKQFGVFGALIIGHFQFWIKLNKNKGSNHKENRTWTYQTQKSIQEQFSYWGLETVKYTIEKLVKDGVLIRKNFNKKKFDKTWWYAFADEELFVGNSKKVCKDNSPYETRKSPYETRKSPAPIPDTKTTYIRKESKPKKVEPPKVIPKKTEATASLASKEAHSFSFSKGIQECADLFENNLKSVRSNYKITEAIRLEWMRNMNEIVATGEGTVEEIHDVLVWVSGNVFWHNRIHTGKTLRSKFSKLCSYMNPRLKSNNTNSLGYDKNSDKDYDEKNKLLSGLCEYLVTRYQRDMFKINRLKHTDSYFKDESKNVFISVKYSLNEMKEKIFCNYPEFKLCYKY